MNDRKKLIVALTSVISVLEKQGCAGIFRTIELKDGTKIKIDCVEEIKNYIDGNSMEFGNFKLYADSTLKNMTKDELISYIHAIYHNWKCADIEKERFHKIICDLTNNQPYKFEDLRIGMWVYDTNPDVEEIPFFKIKKILSEEECKYLYNDKNKKIFIDNLLEFTREFEEGRYFPITKAMEEFKNE